MHDTIGRYNLLRLSIAHSGHSFHSYQILSGALRLLITERYQSFSHQKASGKFLSINEYITTITKNHKEKSPFPSTLQT